MLVPKAAVNEDSKPSGSEPEVRPTGDFFRGTVVSQSRCME